MSTVNKGKVFLYVLSGTQIQYSSVERHVLANQKVWGSILRLGRPFFNI